MKYGDTLYAALSDPKVDKAAFKAELASSNVVRALKNELQNRTTALLSTSHKDYDKASWSHYQAHKNGEVDILKQLLDLLS